MSVPTEYEPWVQLAAAMVERARADLRGDWERPIKKRWEREKARQTAREFLQGPLFANIAAVVGQEPEQARLRVLKKR